MDLPQGNVIVEELQEFVEWVRKGTPSEADAQSGVETLAVVLAAVESMKSGRAVEMKDYLAANGA